MLTARGLKVIKTMLIKTLDITVRCGMEVDFAHKIGCHGNVPWGIAKITADRPLRPKFYKSCKFRRTFCRR